jgi:hypothetical protein
MVFVFRDRGCNHRLTTFNQGEDFRYISVSIRLTAPSSRSEVLAMLYSAAPFSLRHVALAAASACLIACVAPVAAEELPLASDAEVSQLGPEGAVVYTAGVVSLDRADIRNAYRHMTRVAMMAPDSPTVNELASVLALKLGRSSPAAEAQGYYDVAVQTSKHVLDSDAPNAVKRRVANRLKLIQQEREALTARDARRESIGNAFLQEYSRSFRTPTPVPTQRRAAPPVPQAPQQVQQPGVQQQFSNLQTGGEVVDTGAAGRGNYFGQPTLGRNPAVEF